MGSESNTKFGPKISPECVVKVGDGRGFVFNYRQTLPPHPGWKRFRELRLVITAAHCLPKLPPAHRSSYLEERTYKDLLGALKDQEGKIYAECLFADPVGDVAVLGSPDDQELSDQAAAYDTFVEGRPALRIGEARRGTGWVLSLDGKWVRTTVDRPVMSFSGTSLTVEWVKAGMSGSPILNDVGRAIGLLAVGSETVGFGGERIEEEASGQPILSQCLPGWMLHSKKAIYRGGNGRPKNLNSFRLPGRKDGGQ